MTELPPSNVGSGKNADKFDDLACHLQTDKIIIDRKAIKNRTRTKGAKFRQLLQTIQRRKLDKNKFINPRVGGGFEDSQILQEGTSITNFKIHKSRKLESIGIGRGFCLRYGYSPIITIQDLERFFSGQCISGS